MIRRSSVVLSRREGVWRDRDCYEGGVWGGLMGVGEGEWVGSGG